MEFRSIRPEIFEEIRFIIQKALSDIDQYRLIKGKLNHIRTGRETSIANYVANKLFERLIQTLKISIMSNLIWDKPEEHEVDDLGNIKSFSINLKLLSADIHANDFEIQGKYFPETGLFELYRFVYIYEGEEEIEEKDSEFDYTYGDVSPQGDLAKLKEIAENPHKLDGPIEEGNNNDN